MQWSSNLLLFPSEIMSECGSGLPALDEEPSSASTERLNEGTMKLMLKRSAEERLGKSQILLRWKLECVLSHKSDPRWIVGVHGLSQVPQPLLWVICCVTWRALTPEPIERRVTPYHPCHPQNSSAKRLRDYGRTFGVNLGLFLTCVNFK